MFLLLYLRSAIGFHIILQPNLQGYFVKIFVNQECWSLPCWQLLLLHFLIILQIDNIVIINIYL